MCSIECKKAKQRRYASSDEVLERNRKRNRERYRNDEKFREARKARAAIYNSSPEGIETVKRRRESERGRLIALINGAKNRAKTKGLDYDLTIEWATESLPTTCPVLGIPLSWGTSSFMGSSPSIDRLLPERGYLMENCRIISLRANTIKTDATIEEFRAVLRYMEENISEDK